MIYSYWAIYFTDTKTLMCDGDRDEVVRFMTPNGAENAIATLSRCKNRECKVVEVKE
jgi:hypothetical protein